MAKNVCKVLAVSLVMLASAITASGASAGSKVPAAEAKNKSTPAKEKSEIKKLTYDGPDVLDPTRFFGAASMGYAAAKACPEVMSRLFCYCGCDISDNHKSLVDCFTSNHGVDCHICQEEAILALKLHRDNTPLADIQKQIDQEYSPKYPWKDDSPAYTKYKSTRLWKATEQKPGTTTAYENSGTEQAGPEEPAKAASKKGASPGSKFKDGKWKPVAKAGFHPGACCSKENEEKK